MEHFGVKFYSKYDMSAGSNLQEAEAIFQSWDEYLSNPDINMILELYNIKQYFDAGIQLVKWDDAHFSEYTNKSKQIPGIIGRFCNTISDENIEVLCMAVDRNYADDFWQVICDFKVYKRISPIVLKHLLDSDDTAVWYILCHRVLSTSFGLIISEHLMNNKYTAERLISHFLEARERGENPLYFPAEFTQKMRDKVLADFVEQENMNINCLRLLAQAQSSKEFPISDRLKLKARNRSNLLQEKLFADSAGMSYGVEVSFRSIPDGSVEETFKNNDIFFAYSREWIKENQDYPTLLNNFIYLFKYVDLYHRCTFVSLTSQLGVLERHLGVKGKKDYIRGIVFNVKRMQSLLQMHAYLQELKEHGVRLEDVFRWFFEVYLKEEFNAEGFSYCPPSEGTTYAEKCKLLAISIDGVLKQYRLFCEDGYVNRELLEMSSGHIVFSDLASLRKNKYAYSNSAEIRQEQFFLYSDQSMLSYTEKTDVEYKTVPQLLMNEKITKEDYRPYQQNEIHWLIDRGSVTVNDDGYLGINKDRAYVMKDLFDNEVVCPMYYSQNLRQLVEELVDAGEMRYEGTLFSKPEQDYLNFVLNKSEFSDGLDLRNRYSHDTCSQDENTQFQDYLELLKIMVLIIIKINEEFCAKM